MTDPADTAAAVVLSERQGGVALLTFNRPERLNALNTELMQQLLTAINAAGDDDTVHVLVLTGAGRAFTSGADLEGMQKSAAQDQNDAARVAGRNLFERLEQALESFPKPLIAAANGLGVGFGFTLLGYCDFVLVAENARFRTPFSQLGLCPEASSSYLFPLRMGWAAASRALLLGEWFSAQDVVDCGLAQRVVAQDDLLDAALQLAQQLALCPLQSLRATKQLMLEAHLPHIKAIRERESETMRSLLGTPANRDAVQAFFARAGKGAK